MTALATTTDRSSSPAPATRPLLDLVSRFQNRLEAKYVGAPEHGQRIISASLAPQGEHRAALEARRHELTTALAGEQDDQERKAIGKTVAALLGGFPTYGASAETARDLVTMTVRALDGVPLWAVRSAAQRFIRGEHRIAWNPERAPTAPQIRAEALQGMLPIEGELHRICQILDAELVDTETTEDERTAALARWNEVRAGITRTNKVGQRTDDEIAKERAEQLRANERCRAIEARTYAPTPSGEETTA